MSFILGIFVGRGCVPKTNLAIDLDKNSIPLQMKISKIGAISETYTLNQEETYIIFNIINNLTFSNQVCDGISSYVISCDSDEKEKVLNYSVEVYDKEIHICGHGCEARLSDEPKEQLDKIINKVND